MIKKTKKSLQEEVRVLQKELEYIKAKEKKAKEKPLYVVYPEHDYADLWYRNNKKDIDKFHSDENNFTYWIKTHGDEHMGYNGWKELASKHGNRKWSHHWSSFYIHGKLEEEIGYDICDFNLQFPFDEQLPTAIFQEKEFIEGFGILYRLNAKLPNGKDVLIIAKASVKCTLRKYLEDITTNPFEFTRFAQQHGFIKPSGDITENYQEKHWRLRNHNENYAHNFGFKAVYPIIPHDWGYWKDYLKKYKLVKINSDWNGSTYRLDKLGKPYTFDKSIKWSGRVIYPDDEESLKHCMNALSWH